MKHAWTTATDGWPNNLMRRRHVIVTLTVAISKYLGWGGTIRRKYINGQIAMVQDTNLLSLEEVAEIVYSDRKAFEAFKKLWAEPGWILTDLDELLVKMTLVDEAHDEPCS